MFLCLLNSFQTFPETQHHSDKVLFYFEPTDYLRVKKIMQRLAFLKVNSVLDHEPKNYSNLSSFSIHSNFAVLLEFFHVFVNLIQFLNESKITICMESIYSYLRRKIYHVQDQSIFTESEK